MRRIIASSFMVACHQDPYLVEHPTATHTFIARADTTCGQELAATSVVASGAKYGETIVVETCGRHAIAGDVFAEYTANGTRHTATGSFGDAAETHARCLAGTPTTLANAASTSGGASGTPASPGGTAASGAATTTSFALVETRGMGICPDGSEPQHAANVFIYRPDPKTPIAIRIVSRTPQDLAGAVIRIRHAWYFPNVSEEKYLAFWEKEAQKAEQSPVTYEAPPPVAKPLPPPPAPRAETQPPSPSRAAIWIPGYWHFASEWIWIGGWWRIPAGDELVRAPREAPPLRAELVPAPAAGLAWVAGYWAWDLRIRGFVWVDGRWRKN